MSQLKEVHPLRRTVMTRADFARQREQQAKAKQMSEAERKAAHAKLDGGTNEIHEYMARTPIRRY